jgi:hypothetical protein
MASSYPKIFDSIGSGSHQIKRDRVRKFDKSPDDECDVVRMEVKVDRG